MKSRTKSIISVVAVGALGAVIIGTSAFADYRGGKRGPGGHHFGGRMIQLFETYDTNNDGKVTQEEIDAVRAGQMTEYDKNGDGALSLEEYQALWNDVMRERMVDRFQSHDNDGDGQVTMEEYTKRSSRIVERFDRNDDGALDRNDRPQRGERRQWRRGGRDQ